MEGDVAIDLKVSTNSSLLIYSFDDRDRDRARAKQMSINSLGIRHKRFDLFKEEDRRIGFSFLP
jgi:hypothetical protein